MLRELTIQNIVLIESLHLEWREGLTVMTGETGAGKSILLDALGLALGNRAETRLVRVGCEQGMVSAAFSYDRDGMDTLLKEQGIEPEETLRIRRVVKADGGSKAFVNDVPVGIALLQRLGERLVEIHGQHDQKGLLEVANHIGFLDATLSDAHLLQDTGAAYESWQGARKAYGELKARAEKAMQEQEYLSHVLGELKQLAPQPGEEEELSEKRRRLMGQEKLHKALEEAIGLLTEGTNITGALLAAERQVQSVIDLASEILEPAQAALDRASIEVAEAISALEHAQASLREDDYSLETIEERLFALRAAARKYHRTVDELVGYQHEVAQSLELIESQDAALQQLQQQMHQHKGQFIAVADKLSAARKRAAEKLQQQVERELGALKMAGSKFRAQVETLENEEQWHQRGRDRVRFEVQTNPGSPLAPIHKIASGGELSRFMLAIKVVLSQAEGPDTMIFDEIDTGVGGAVADSIGKRLAMLAKHHQLLCITHLPQVASYGDHHWRVSKKAEKGVTRTQVQVLSGAQRTEELARMLAGEAITDEARKAAERLMEA